jgi:hypothetical protein
VSNRWWRKAGKQREHQAQHVHGEMDRILAAMQAAQDAELERCDKALDELLWKAPTHTAMPFGLEGIEIMDRPDMEAKDRSVIPGVCISPSDVTLLKNIQDKINNSVLDDMRDFIKELRRHANANQKMHSFFMGGLRYFTDGRICDGDRELDGPERETAMRRFLVRMDPPERIVECETLPVTIEVNLPPDRGIFTLE